MRTSTLFDGAIVAPASIEVVMASWLGRTERMMSGSRPLLVNRVLIVVGLSLF